MLLLSWQLSAWTAFVALAQVIGGLTRKGEAHPLSGVEVAVLTGVAVLASAKAVLEFKGWSLLRREAAHVSPEIAALVKVWLPALVVLVLHAAYLAVALTMIALGVTWGILFSLVTLGLGWRQAWDNPLWNLSKTLWDWFTAEMELLQALAAHPAGALVLALFAALMLLGPTIAAILLLRRAKPRPS